MPTDRARDDTAGTVWRNRRLWLALGVAWLLVVLRSLVYLAYPQSFFDSDQAIVGLMAKHLVEGRAFPLFMYGQAYQMAIDAWVAVPFVLALGPTFEALRLSLIGWNLATATVLMVGLARAGVRPWHALAATVFFTAAPPLTAASLIEFAGNVGPLLFVALLWLLRHRSVWFGAVLAIGFLARDFTIYAVPVLALGDLAGGALVRRERLRWWGVALAAFAAVWLGVTALKPYADLRGPGTRGVPVEGATGSQVENILARVDVAPADLPARAVAMATHHLPRQVGAVRAASPIANQGRDWLCWPLAAALALALWRAVRFGRRTAGFPWYLLGVGTLAAVVYVLVRDAEPVIDRYLLLTLYVPIGIVAAFLASEPRAVWRHAMVAVLVGWGALSAVDHARLAARWVQSEEPDHIQVLADALVDRGITVAEAGYWRAYKTTFMAGERVKVASTDMVRIDEYQRLAAAPDARVYTIRETRDGACPGGIIAGIWLLCPRQP